MSIHPIWAVLIPTTPGRESLLFFQKPNEPNEYHFPGRWRINQDSHGTTWISNLSASKIKVNDTWLEKDANLKLCGAEKISFGNQDESYIFCLMNSQSTNELKRPRGNSKEASPIQEKMSDKQLKIGDELIEELKCPICWNTLQKCATLNPCGHDFCNSCLFAHFKSSVQCPLCKKEATSVTKNARLRNIIELTLKNFPNVQKNSPDLLSKEPPDLDGSIISSPDFVFVGCSSKYDIESKGIIIQQNGVLRQGSWRYSFQEGSETITYPNGEKYEGSSRRSQRNGSETMTFLNGQIYKGEWKDDKREGKGSIMNKDGIVLYEGEWEKDSFHGQGITTFADGVIYEGLFSNGAPVGEGTLKFLDGTQYKGGLKNYQKEGKGVLTFKNGTRFEGNWINDILQSPVKIQYTNGSVYEGEIAFNGVYVGEHEFKCCQKQGKGVITFSNGDVYHGYWLNDQQHGAGKEISKRDQSVYEGHWENGIMVGEGIITYTDGRRRKAKWEIVK